MKNTKPFQIRFPEEILDQLKAVAESQHTTSSEIVRRLVIDYIKKVDKTELSSEASLTAPSEIPTGNGNAAPSSSRLADKKTITWTNIAKDATPICFPEEDPPIDESEMPF